MYDLVIRNGTVVDGSGMPRYRADVAVSGDRIAAIGRVRERGREEIDAAGHVVSPGFIDGHTHMDAQIFWDPLGSCSCWHGITSVVMGNCGFTLAPGSAAQRALILKNIEDAEDIPAACMEAAIKWNWTSFREYLGVLDGLPKAINYAANIGHSSLRTHIMGERAFSEKSRTDDMQGMERELLDALDAGAMGFTTSLNEGHLTPDGGHVASHYASWDEIRHLVNVVGRHGRGYFELAREKGARSADPAERARADDRLRELAVESGVPTTFGVPPGGHGAQPHLDLLDSTAAAGGRMFGQTHPRGVSHILSFRSRTQFDNLPHWKTFRALPLEAQRRALGDPAMRQRLVDDVRNGQYGDAAGQPRKPDFDNMFVVKSTVLPNSTVAELARQRKQDPIDTMLDLALETDFHQLFMQFDARTRPQTEAQALASLCHPRTVMTFSDAGAHVNLIMDTSIQTYLLAWWVRERQAITLEQAVRMITLTPALTWGFANRGLVREGYYADLNVFNPDTIAPDMPIVTTDLPAGAQRLKQKSNGILATIIGGRKTFANGEHTGALGGRLLRSRTGGLQ